MTDSVTELVKSLMELDEEVDQESLTDDFTAASEAGEVTFIGEETMADEAPEECQ